MEGKIFRVTGLVLGIVGVVVSATGIFFAVAGMLKARQCKHCKMEGTFK